MKAPRDLLRRLVAGAILVVLVLCAAPPLFVLWLSWRVALGNR